MWSMLLPNVRCASAAITVILEKAEITYTYLLQRTLVSVLPYVFVSFFALTWSYGKGFQFSMMQSLLSHLCKDFGPPGVWISKIFTRFSEGSDLSHYSLLFVAGRWFLTSKRLKNCVFVSMFLHGTDTRTRLAYNTQIDFSWNPGTNLDTIGRF